jgi:nucleoid-associated protein YgaU
MNDDSWVEYTSIFENESEVYKEYRDNSGVIKVEHYDIVLFGDPRMEDFLEKINITNHIYKTGDRLSKIAHKYYGDPRYWWVLAWFNARPTDFHCKVGDNISVPRPLDEVLLQAHNRAVI